MSRTPFVCRNPGCDRRLAWVYPDRGDGDGVRCDPDVPAVNHLDGRYLKAVCPACGLVQTIRPPRRVKVVRLGPACAVLD